MRPGCSSVDGRSIVMIISMGALIDFFTVKLKGKPLERDGGIRCFTISVSDPNSRE